MKDKDVKTVEVYNSIDKNVELELECKIDESDYNIFLMSIQQEKRSVFTKYIYSRLINKEQNNPQLLHKHSLVNNFIYVVNNIEIDNSISNIMLVDAVEFSVYIQNGMSRTQSFATVFKDNEDIFTNEMRNLSDKADAEISASAYYNNPIVQKVLNATHIDLFDMFGDYVIRSIKRTNEMAENAIEEEVRLKANIELVKMIEASRPKNVKVTHNTGFETLKAQQSLATSIGNLAEVQRKMLEQGHSLQEVQALMSKEGIIDVNEE